MTAHNSATGGDRNEVRAAEDRSEWLAAIAVVLMLAAGLFGMWWAGTGVGV